MSTEDNKPKLETASFEFSQEGNCVDGGVETINIRCESSLGIDNDNGCFFILKTDGWAIDSAKDLEELFNRINNAIKKNDDKI